MAGRAAKKHAAPTSPPNLAHAEAASLDAAAKQRFLADGDFYVSGGNAGGMELRASGARIAGRSAAIEVFLGGVRIGEEDKALVVPKKEEKKKEKAEELTSPPRVLAQEARGQPPTCPGGGPHCLALID